MRFIHPYITMVFLILVNLVIFMDRGIIASVVPFLKFSMTTTQEGALSSTFMLGYLLMGPLWAQMASRVRSTIVMAMGLFVFSIAAIVCGFSGLVHDEWGYYVLVVSRTFVGIGMAAFESLCPTLIEDISPDKLRTTFLTLFYSCIPIGAATGTLFGGALGEKLWMIAFWSVGVFMLISTLIILFVPVTWEWKNNVPRPPPMKRPNIFQAMKLLFTNSIYLLNIGAGAAYTGVVGALAFWTPTLIVRHYDISPLLGYTIFAIISVSCGIIGSIFGGGILSYLIGSVEYSRRLIKRRKTSRSFIVCFVVILLGFPFGVAGFLMKNVIVFFVLMAFAELFLFMTTSPMNVALLSAVPTNLRDFSMSFNVMLIHLFGDLPSPMLVGFIADRTGELHIALLILWCLLVFSLIFFATAGLISIQRYRGSKSQDIPFEVQIDSEEEESAHFAYAEEKL